MERLSLVLFQDPKEICVQLNMCDELTLERAPKIASESVINVSSVPLTVRRSGSILSSSRRKFSNTSRLTFVRSWVNCPHG